MLYPQASRIKSPKTSGFSYGQIRGFGNPAFERSRYFLLWLGCGCLLAFSAPAATITVSTNRIGATPSLLGYNAGHFVPGSNTKDWWRYSETTGARVFITPGNIEPGDDIAGRGDGVTDSSSFVSRKTALRANPLDTNYINWPYFTNNYGVTGQHGSNLLNVNDACSSLRQIGVGILACITASESTFPITDTNDWAGKWELWQHYYAEAFYLARYFDVQRYQMYNEPNGGPTADEFLQRLKLISDAVQCAVADVNTRYGKTLTPWIFTPVTAGTANNHYPDWGKMVVTNRHTDFLGNTSSSFWLLHKYDYHEYNSTPATFGANLASLNSLMSADMSPEPRFPTSISEFNVHTAATFDTLTDTLETPSTYTTFGSLLVNLVKNFCDELYCFKFSQTLNTTTVKKNGMHYVDNSNAPYNIGGILKGGEVFRLFSKGAAPGRDRLNVTLGTGATKLDTIATYDSVAKYYYLFSSSYSNSSDLTLDLTAWNIPSGQRVLLHEVSESIWGGVKTLGTVINNQFVAGTQQTNTVWLFGIPTKSQEPLQTIFATDDAMVQDGANKAANFGSSTVCYVRNNSTNADFRSAALLKFHLPLYYHPDTQIALLAVRATAINGGPNVQAHVYGLSDTNWSQSAVTWGTAPNLAQNVAAGSNYINNVVLGAGNSAQIVGQLSADNKATDRYIDVTKYLRGQSGSDVSFLVTREVRFFGDAQDNDGIAITSNEGNANIGPRLLLVRLKDTDGDGLSDDSETNLFHTNPTLADTDHDGFTDGQEVLLYGTDPLSSVPGPPSITVPPAGQTVNVGSTVNFTVSANGTPPLAYQWYFTNAVVSATNSNLTLPNVQLYESGNYSVRVSNSAGAVTSTLAQLIVQAIPPAPLPVYDPLGYVVGTPLDGQGNWVLTGAGTSGTIQAGNLSVPDLASSTGNRLAWTGASMSLRMVLGTSLTSGQVYFSFPMRVDSLGSAFTTPGTLAGFASGTTTLFGTKVNIRPNGIGGFNLGTSKYTGMTFGAWAPNNFNVGDTIFVVGRYTYNGGSPTDDTCDLWLNPPSSSFGAASAPAATVAAAGAGGNDMNPIDRFFFRSGGSSSSPSQLVADEVRVGLTWAEVTPPAPPSLAIHQAGSSVLVSWPTNSSGFTLQSAASILTPISWSNLPTVPSVDGSNYTLTIPTTNSLRFFRLAR